jgi:hypothetical protein
MRPRELPQNSMVLLEQKTALWKLRFLQNMIIGYLDPIKMKPLDAS